MSTPTLPKSSKSSDSFHINYHNEDPEDHFENELTFSTKKLSKN